MRKSRSREARSPTRLLGAVGLVTVIGAGAAVAGELLHRKAVASDPAWRLLRAPLRGATVSARSADGTELHAEVFGSADAATFVLVPGWTEELQFFDLVTRGLLGRGFRVVSYDLRAQGASGVASRLDQAIERYGEDLAAVLDATCRGRDDVIVAGHSMGGMAIVAWAGQAGVQRGVRAAALISTGLSGLVDAAALLPESIPPGARREVLMALLASDQPLPPLSTPVSRAINRYMLFGPSATAAQIAFLEPMVWRMQPKLRAAAARTMRDLDLTAALPSLTVPTLVVVGDVDRMTPPVHARLMVAALPHVAAFVLLPETGHMVPLERPAELVDALVGLAGSVGLSGAALPKRVRAAAG
jgi:pimeloyl-ACP methyl ester carboxylesterase